MSNQAQITITYYFGPSNNPSDKLSKTYILQNWEGEAHLRALVDEVAKEINYISGYGILSIRVKSALLNFTADYTHQFKPYTQEGHLLFHPLLRFVVGQQSIGRRGGLVRVEIPRVNHMESDHLFKIVTSPIGNKKARQRTGTVYHLRYDPTDPLAAPFFQKLSDNILAPDTKNKWEHFGKVYQISWWYLPEDQTTIYRWHQSRKDREAEEKQRQKLEKAGIVYKDKKQTKKANQVYIVKIEDESFSNICKIGISNAPGKRLQALNTSNPFQLKMVHTFVAEPAEEAEAQLHTMFAGNRMSGEWFKLTDEQLADLKQITEFKNGKFIKSE